MTADLSKDALGKRYTFRMLLETLWGGHNPAPACFGIAREVWLSEADPARVVHGSGLSG